MLLMCTSLFVIMTLSMVPIDAAKDPKPFILWQPFNNISREEFFATYGYPKKKFQFLVSFVPRLKQTIAELNGREIMDPENLSPIFDDLIFSPKQVQFLLDFYTEVLENKKNPKRKKRKIFNNKTFPLAKWTMPIPYKIDDGFDDVGLQHLVGAISAWEEYTCIKFKKLDTDEKFNDPHILFEAKFDQCSSHVGKNTDVIPQSVFLGRRVCPKFIGIVIHEIGHAIGLFHEQNRYDSKDFVKVILDQLEYGSEGQMLPFEKDWMNIFGVPYDLGSVMQYDQFSFSKSRKPKKPTIEALQKIFQNNMGQRTGLSFYDIKIANLEYCKDICPPLDCKRGGFPNPSGNKCTECICPDGFGGAKCETAAKSDPGCSPNSQNIIDVTSTTEQCLKSPNYGQGGYTPKAKCNWLLKADSGKKIKMRFKDEFNVFCFPKTFSCFHWVEVKYRNLSNPGPRFCCSRTPTVELISDDNEAVVTFRSNHDDEDVKKSNLTGFQLCYRLDSSGPTEEPTTKSTKPTQETTTTSPSAQTTPRCPKGFKYSVSTTGCPATCADPKAPKNCNKPKISGCVCKGATVLQDGKCIKVNKCKCVDASGKKRKKGDTWLSSNCQQEFTCNAGITVTNTGHKCSPAEQCQADDGVGECVQKPIECPLGKIVEVRTPLNFQHRTGLSFTVIKTRSPPAIFKGSSRTVTLMSPYTIEITPNVSETFRLKILEFKVSSANQTGIIFFRKGARKVQKTINLDPTKTTPVFLITNKGLPAKGLDKITKIQITFMAVKKTVQVSELELQTCVPQVFIFVPPP